MKKAVGVLVLLVVLLPFSQAATLVTVDLPYLTKYLDQMGLKYETDPEKGFAHMIMVGDHGNYDTYVIANTESALAFIVISDYMTVKPDHRNCDRVLRRLMELNWKLNVGKFEWDPTYGEVRITFTFSTENGVGYDAFKAVFETLTTTADEYKEELERLLVGD
ncbi:MAG: YbjN domain-containing protein [Armatimonadetes bacterium]|nr:YbjN domain-containing protein [Armatimonadota bacterium]